MLLSEELLKPVSLSRGNGVVRGRAPLRISFCGGGTDVSPYPERYGGCVLSCTIDKYAYVSVRQRAGEDVRVVSEDLGIEVYFDVRADNALDGRLDLAHTILKRFGIRGTECHLQTDAPPGSGMGSSSAMIVALISALARHKGLHFTSEQTAELAVLIERHDLGIAGGLQDQYASAFGGFNFIEFSTIGTVVTPLRLPIDTIAELHYHLVLCGTGGTRLSSNIIREQTRNVERNDEKAMRALAEMKRMAVEMKAALLKNRLRDFGLLLGDAWDLKRNLASEITNARIEEFYARGRAAGAIGGKLLGAGGGGYLLMFVPFNRRSRVREALASAGGRIVDFQFDYEGARSWSAYDETWTDAPDRSAQ